MHHARVASRISRIRLLAFCCLLGTAVDCRALPVDVGSTPGNGVELTIAAIRAARRSLRVNIYEMKSKDIADALVDRIEEGLHVEVLGEGEPVGGLSDVALGIRKRIVKAMRSASAHAADRYWVMEAHASGEKARRYKFDHAKYTLIDDEALLIGSENYSATVKPGGKKKNRGWQVVIHDEKIARQYRAIYDTDSDPRNDDIREIVGDRSGRLPLIEGFLLSTTIARHITDAVDLSLPTETLDAARVAKLLSPDDSLQELLKLINEAEHSIELEMMTFSPRWGATGKRSPLLAATIAAAQRGVKMRILLNDETVFGGGRDDSDVEEELPVDSSPKNPETCDTLNSLADELSLSVECRIADVKAMGVSYIHNKGGMVDGRYVLISSINWNQNSVENNREAAVVLDGPEIYRYYRKIFDADWKASEDR